MNQTKEKMISEGLREGKLVELTLKNDASLSISGVVPTYVPNRDPQKRIVKGTGYAVEITDDVLGLIPVWDEENQKHPAFLHIGGVNYYWDAIESFKIK